MDSLYLWIALGVLFTVLLGLFIKRVILNPVLQYHSCWYKVKSAIIFKLGDIRWIGFPGMVTWDCHQHGMSMKDVRDADAICQPGDIGLHRDSGYLSNLGIPGAFKHAWVVVDGHDCVEALSEGVVKRDRMAPLLTDYAVILRPKNMTEYEKKEAVIRANGIVGCDYDVNFNFNFEETEEKQFATNLKGGGFHAAFSCTEVAGYSWYHKKKELRIFRTRQAGREAIVADDYLTMNFDVVYVSPSVTPEWAKSMGLGEAAREKLVEYWKSRKS